MNKERRKALQDIIAKLDDLDIESIKEELYTLKEEEHEYLENMPESFQFGEKGEAAQAAIDAMGEAMSTLDEIIDAIDNAKSQIETAQE